MKPALASLLLVVAAGLAGVVAGVVMVQPTIDAAPAVASILRDDVKPCANGQQPAPGTRCRGPVDNESGGGGGALTIIVSVVVGLAIAAVAFVVLRRQLASPRPPPSSREKP
jgi:hypothetical protein